MDEKLFLLLAGADYDGLCEVEPELRVSCRNTIARGGVASYFWRLLGGSVMLEVLGGTVYCVCCGDSLYDRGSAWKEWMWGEDVGSGCREWM